MELAGPSDRDPLFAIALQPQRRLRRGLVHQHLTLGDELLHAGSTDLCVTDIRKLRREILVKALSCSIGGDNESYGKFRHLWAN